MFWLSLRSTAQYGAHSGEQFRKCERFDQIIVCTELESFDTVAHTVASGKKENWCTHPLVAELCDHFPTVLVWQHDVDDQKIKFFCERPLQTSLAIVCNVDSKTGFTESFGQESRRFLFVLDDENRHCEKWGPVCGSPASIRAARKARQSPSRRGEM